MKERYNKIAGSLIGGAIGDALGYQIEFTQNIKDKEVTRYNNIGIISDDTQMSLFTANALLWRETRFHMKGIAIDPVYAIYCAYLDWLETQTKQTNEHSISWIKNIPELKVNRAPGNTCLSSLSSGKMGLIDEPINDSKGCGSVMRVAPIGLYVKNSKLAGELAMKSCALTHGHQLAYISSYVMACMINLILYEDMSISNALDMAIQLIKEEKVIDQKYLEDFILLVNRAVELSKSSKKDIDAIKELGAGWVADEAFAIAIYACLKYSNDFEKAIICAVNHDGDSDSTGSIAGNIIGVSLGFSIIPGYYLKDLELKNIILEIAHDLSIDVPVNEYSNNMDEKWLSKYVYGNYCRKGDNV